MIEKILISSIIGIVLNSLKEKSYNIEAIYELKQLQTITLLITTRCNITKIEIDGEIVDNIFVVYSEHYYQFKNAGIHTIYWTIDISTCESFRSAFIGTDIISIKFLDDFKDNKFTSIENLFYGCNKLTSIDISNLSTKYVTDMKYAFFECSELTSIDLSNFDTKYVKSMDSMFYGCKSLKSIDLSNFDTSNVTSMEEIFSPPKNQ